MMYKDRTHAARELLDALDPYKQENVLVMAVPRGGVPLGYEIARAWEAPLDIVFVKKLPHPDNEEYAIGSVGLESLSIQDSSGIAEDYIQEQNRKIRETLQERKQKYLGNYPRKDPSGKTVILVDDGIATGRTMAAAAAIVKKEGAHKIIIAAPVGPPDAEEYLQNYADKVILLQKPSLFMAISQFYQKFDQLSDEAVISIMQEANTQTGS